MKRAASILLVLLATSCSHDLATPGRMGRQPINASGQAVRVTALPRSEKPTSLAPARAVESRVPINAKRLEPVSAQIYEPTHVGTDTYTRERSNVYRVHFGPGATTFSPDAAVVDEIRRLAPGAVRINVFGRTDGKTASTADAAVALKRALAARDFLIRAGAAPSRVFVQFESASDYLGDNSTTFGQGQNRRVEIQFE